MKKYYGSKVRPKDCWVHYSPVTNKFKLSIDGRRIISFTNREGTMWVKEGYLSKTYEPIGRLVQDSFYCDKKGLYFL